MNNNDATNFIQRLKQISLTPSERLSMRERLALHADLHPASAPKEGVVSPFFAFFSSRSFSVAFVALLVAVVLGGGVTLAAEGSVPGESLYAIKIHVNEPFMTALATSPDTQAEVATTIAARRIDEAVRLASRDELTPDRQNYLTSQFNANVETATKKTNEIAMVNSKKADTLKATLAAHLANEAEALGAVKTKNTDGKGALLNVVVATTQDLTDNHFSIAVALNTVTETATGTATDTATDTPTADTVSTVAISEPEGETATITLKRAALTITGTSSATTSSTTQSLPPPKPGRQIHITSTTTLRARLATSTLPAFNILMPKVDVAIPMYLNLDSGTQKEHGKGHIEKLLDM